MQGLEIQAIAQGDVHAQPDQRQQDQPRIDGGEHRDRMAVVRRQLGLAPDARRQAEAALADGFHIQGRGAAQRTRQGEPVTTGVRVMLLVRHEEIQSTILL